MFTWWWRHGGGAMADNAISWNSIYYSDRSNLAEINFLEFL